MMLFKSKKALEFLLKNGEVYTARPRKRREGRDWVTNKPFGKKIANVTVKLVAIVHNDSFEAIAESYVSKSGFSSMKEWIEEIKKLNKGRIPRKLYIYHVKLKGLRCPDCGCEIGVCFDCGAAVGLGCNKCEKCGSEFIVCFNCGKLMVKEEEGDSNDNRF